MKANANKAIVRAKQMCANKGYTLLTTEDEYNGVNNTVRYLCPIHGEQIALFENIIHGHGCDQCARECKTDKIELDKAEIIKRIERIDGNKLLNPDDYINVFENNMLVKCKCGNVFKTSIQNYRVVNACAQCLNSESRGERTIRKYLEDNTISFEQEKRFITCRDKIPLPFDFYLPLYNMCIEYDGEQHYWPVFSVETTEITKRHDAIKNQFCIDNNIQLLRIPYYKYKDITNILDNALQVKDIV